MKSAIGNKIELPRRAIALAGFFLFGLNLVASGFGQARAATHDEELKLYAVNIFRTPPQPWRGYGIYLGNGLVITAAHVVGHAYLFNPKVLIAGQTLEAKVVKEGDFEKVDLTLLSIDARRLPARIGLRLMPLCDAPPSAGQSVVVATPEAVARSRVLSPQYLPADIRDRFDTVIADVASTGNSGSGVFDAASQCLLGVIEVEKSSDRLL